MDVSYCKTFTFLEFLWNRPVTGWPDWHGTWTTYPLELKKITYSIYFELEVLLAKQRIFSSHCLLSALLCGWNMCTMVPPIRLSHPRFFKISRAHLRRWSFCSKMSNYLSMVPTLFQKYLQTIFCFANAPTVVRPARQRFTTAIFALVQES